MPVVELNEAVELLRNGASIKQSEYAGGTPITRIETIADWNINPERCGYADVSEDDFPNHILKDGDILISHINSTKHLGKCALYKGAPEKLIHGMNLLGLRVNPDVAYSDYIYRVLCSQEFRRQLPKITKNSVNQSSFTVTNFKALKIPLPPLKEQKRIAAILDKADAICRKRQQAINLTDQLLRSVFLDMFGDPVTNPKRWRVVPVGDVTDCIVPGRDKPKSFTGDTPWITTNDLVHLGVTKLPQKFTGLTVGEIKEVKAKVIPENSVLMTCVGNLGVISIVGLPMVINQQLHAFQCGDELESRFLMYALSFQKNYMLKMASSTTVPYMNKTVCNSVPVIIPAMELQRHFSQIANKISQSLVLKEDSEVLLSDLFSSLTQNAFSGELTSQTKAA